MRKKSALLLGTAGLVAATLLGASISAAIAAEPNGSDGPYYILDSETLAAPVPAGGPVNWNTSLVGSPLATSTGSGIPAEVIDGPDDSTAVTVFVAPRGQERVRASWISTTATGFANATTKTVNLPTASLSSLTVGNFNSIKAGGQYSFGIGFTKDGGNTVTAAHYAFITVTSSANPATGGATWTFETPAGPPAPPVGSFTSNLSAQAINGVDGNLSLVAPLSANVTIGNPVLTGGTSGLSVSTGTLGQFSVIDGRPIAKPGWRLQTTVADFSGGISKVQLGVKPVLVAAGTDSTGVVLGAEQVAGSAVYPSTFASAAINNGVGTTNFNADLRFVAPAGTPAGTYTSTLTITLVAP